MRIFKVELIRPVNTAVCVMGIGVLLFQSTDSVGQSCVAPPSGLVSWWRGDGDASDWTGAHNGVFANGVSFTNGVVGQAFALDGVSGAIDAGPWFNLQVFSITLWVKASASQQFLADIIDNYHSSVRSWVVQAQATGTDFNFIRPTNGTGPTVSFT